MVTRSKIFLSALFALSGIFVFLSFYSGAVAQDKFYVCETDDQCGIIDVCAQAVPVNQKYSKAAKRALSSAEQACLAVVPPEMFSHVGICVENKCAMRPMVFSKDENCSDKALIKERNHCFYQQALAKNDFELCGQMSVDSHDCVGEVFRNLKQDDEPSLGLCENVPRADLSADCYHQFADVKGNPDICFNIEDEKIRSKCLVSPSSTRDGQPYWSQMTAKSCEMAKKDGYKDWSDRCLLHLSNKSQKQCHDIQENTLWFDCLREVALSSDDLSVCNDVNMRQFEDHYPKRVYSVAGCQSWVRNGGAYK